MAAGARTNNARRSVYHQATRSAPNCMPVTQTTLMLDAINKWKLALLFPVGLGDGLDESRTRVTCTSTSRRIRLRLATYPYWTGRPAGGLDLEACLYELDEVAEILQRSIKLTTQAHMQSTAWRVSWC